ncbi:MULTISPECIES: ribonuclease III [Thiomicrorhabdus]|uniref:Ribonuclease 3 n=1 Tax=Thiomicrorhabdus heinhorstiae TaxID=2748010 RepID=A0ABS0BYJ4_9GAMM|nr:MULTISPECIES: ribonuclease III [Thiomicrorhabdus]MBF6057921.1 ribonuclease III [Thiomicrorhabdus heinhorstiae]
MASKKQPKKLSIERQAKLDQLAKALGYQYQDINYLEKALTHRSVGAQNNERLEFLGDSLVNFMIADALFHQFGKLPEGDMSRVRAHLVKGDTLAQIGREYQLSDYLVLGPGELKSGGFRRDSIIADAVEAIIASVYEDGGLDECRALVERFYTQRLQKLDPKKVGKDPKTRLQEFLQSVNEPLPEYSIISVNGAAHAQEFTVSCYVAKLNTKFEATASSRRKAEQKAAEIALEHLGEL